MLLDLLTLPVLGAPRMVAWLGQQVLQEVEGQALDERAIRGELLELWERYDAGVLPDEEYDRQEAALLERLNALHETKSG